MSETVELKAYQPVDERDAGTLLRDLLRTLPHEDIVDAINGVSRETQGALWNGLHNQGWIGAPTSISDLQDRVFYLLDTKGFDADYTPRVMASIGQAMWEQAVTLSHRSWDGRETELSNVVETSVSSWLDECPWSRAVLRDDTEVVLGLIDIITGEVQTDPPNAQHFDHIRDRISESLRQLPPDAVLAVANYPCHNEATWQLLNKAVGTETIAHVTPILLTSEPWRPDTSFKQPPAGYVPASIDLTLDRDDASSLAELLVAARQQLFIPESRTAETEHASIELGMWNKYVDTATQIADSLQNTLSDYPPAPITPLDPWATDERPYSNPEAVERGYLWDLSRGLNPDNPYMTSPIVDEPLGIEQDWGLQ
jgi:hypothetical protein